MERVVRHRVTARVLPVSAAGEVLLLHGWDPAEPGAPFWFSVGGALEPGEDHRAAAVRELHEETGLVIDPAALIELGREPAEFDWGAWHLVQDQTWFACPLEPAATHFDGLEEAEVGTIDEARWWTPDALETSDELDHHPLVSFMRSAVERVVS